MRYSLTESGGRWYIKERAPIAGVDPVVVAMCNTREAAERVLYALTAVYDPDHVDEVTPPGHKRHE